MSRIRAWSRARGSRLVRWDELGSDEIQAWHTLRASNPDLDSPYFHPGFAAAVHATGRPVHVVVIDERAGRVTALLPGHLEGSRFMPPGWPAADFQGPILSRDLPPDSWRFVPDGIDEVYFDHLVASVPQFDPWITGRRMSPFIDTSGGLEGYLGRANALGRKHLAKAGRLLAKAEQTVGPVRFTANSLDEEHLFRLIALKQAQYTRTGGHDSFTPHRVELLSRLMHTRGEDFAGLLSTIHVGDRLAAAHFGIRSGEVLHWWFPVYDLEFARLAPGWILLREVITAAPRLGLRRIDLGRGSEEWKRHAKTGDSVVCQARLAPAPDGRALRNLRQRLRPAWGILSRQRSR